MSAILTSSRTVKATPTGPLKVTQGRVVRSEWIKFRSVRSTVWTLLSAVVLMVGIGPLFSAVSASQYHTFTASDRASFSAVSVSLEGIAFAVIAFGVLGVLEAAAFPSTKAATTPIPSVAPSAPR